MNYCKNCKWFESAEWVIGVKSKNIDKWAKLLSEAGYGDCMRASVGSHPLYSAIVSIGKKEHDSTHLFYHKSFGCIEFKEKQ